MSPGHLDPAVMADRAAWVRSMLAGIRSLPLQDIRDFTQDRHGVAAAESYLRRAIEALVDLARHILSKRFAMAVSEYKAVPPALAAAGVLPGEEVRRFVQICGFRNRLVHFYHTVSEQELFEICVERSGEIEQILALLLKWYEAHPED